MGETARRFKIPLPNISRWKKQESELLEQLGTQRRNRVGKRKWPKIEQSLYEMFLARREEGKFVRRGWFRKTSKELMATHYPDNIFHFSNGWFNGNVFISYVHSKKNLAN